MRRCVGAGSGGDLAVSPAAAAAAAAAAAGAECAGGAVSCAAGARGGCAAVAAAARGAPPGAGARRVSLLAPSLLLRAVSPASRCPRTTRRLCCCCCARRAKEPTQPWRGREGGAAGGRHCDSRGRAAPCSCDCCLDEEIMESGNLDVFEITRTLPRFGWLASTVPKIGCLKPYRIE